MGFETKGPEKNNLDAEKIRNFLLNSVQRRLKGKLKDLASSDLDQAVDKSITGEFGNILKSLGYDKDAKNDALAPFIENATKKDLTVEANLREYINSVATPFTEFLLSKWDIKEIETSLREYFSTNKPDRIKINDLVYVDIKDEETNALKLHLLAPFIQGPNNMRELFYDAMKKITEQIKEGKFPCITKVIGDSLFVYKNQELLKPTGFVITEVNKENETARAEMAVEELLKRYSQ